MRLLTIISVITINFAGASGPGLVESQVEDVVSLAVAVRAFNAEAATDPIGKDQSPMTEEEVVAAIRAWEREKGSPVSDELCDVFKQIAKTRKLPKDADFETTRSWIPKGDFHYDVWWVRIMFRKEDGSTYSFPIRQRMIRSMPYDEVWKKKIIKSPDGSRYVSVIPRSLEGSEELKFLPHGPYSSVIDSDDREILGQVKKEYEYQEWCTAKDETSFQALKTEIKALRQRLRRLEKRLIKVEKGQHK